MYDSMSDVLKVLVGRRVDGLSVGDGETVLAFATDAGPIAFGAQGDCCSQSWFADITGVSCLLGSVVRSVETRDLTGYNVDDGRTRQESDAAYGFTVATDKGRCDVVFRCSSNGYYGGWIESYDGVMPSDMREIRDDWQA